MSPPAQPFAHLDPVTLCLAVSVLGFVLATVSALAARADPAHRPALRAWAGSMAVAGLAAGLVFLRGHVPFVLSFVVGNTLALLVPALGLRAWARLFGVPLPAGPVVVAVLTGVLAAVGGYLDGLSVQRSASIMSLMAGLMMLGEALLCAQQAQVRRSTVGLVGTAAMVLGGIALLARAITVLEADAALAVPTSAPGPQLAPVLLSNALYLVLASTGFLAVVHERQRLQALDQARRDGLTGTFTRAAFFDKAAAVDGRCALLMLDIDHFKRVNDRYGHRGGDLVLAHAARLMMSAVRIDDLVGRYGGEEFCILLRGCGIAEAEALARRLVHDARSASVRLPDGRSVTYTLSAGYAAREPDEALGDALERADIALYRAKHRGRDRAEAAPQPGLQASSA